MFVRVLVAVVLVTLLLSGTEGKKKCRKYSNWQMRIEMSNRLPSLDSRENRRLKKMMTARSAKPLMNDVLCDMDRCEDMEDMDEIEQTACSIRMAARTLQLMNAEVKFKNPVKSGNNKPNRRVSLPAVQPDPKPSKPAAKVPKPSRPAAKPAKPFIKPLSPYLRYKMG